MRATPKPTALHQVRTAVLANMRPGLVLWSGLVLLLLAYLWSPAVQSGLTQWGMLKQAWGYPGSFVTYAAFAVLVPELLAWAVLRQPVPRTIARDMAFAIVVFGLIGISVDVLYSVQVALFGSGNDAATIVKKMLFDQFVYSPVSNFVMVAVFLWKDEGFRTSTLRTLASGDFWSRRYLPVIIAVWCVWGPGVLVIYFMPTALQFPVASLILSFWILIFKFMRQI
ncbi:hypothetical protein [Rhodoferax sp. TS-BS-61-7]|uniref:hypothetical protein n=1 Tax=Rhodoferax sp. TS-BS-61-7 TaxID=2094194 RepID=UPI000CF72822|nr:hypothetical protein [Rhodoferax sp. TS-BS-61-7]PQA77217.1 hypothetical protein C5F53_13375 [Rhodoferax sp. TS-BS-61-7]